MRSLRTLLARPAPRRSGRRAFTLVELLTVVAVLGILAAILLATVGRVRAKARSSVCASNLRQLGLAVQLYTQENRHQLPVAFTTYTEPDNNWWYWLSPYVGGKRMTLDWGNIALVSMLDGPYHCPAVVNPDPATPNVTSNAWVSYKMNDQTRTLAPASSQSRPPGQRFASTPAGVPLSRVARPARTLLIAEGRVTPRFNTWLAPAENVGSGLWYPHGDRLNAAFVDGHVESFDLATLSARWNELYPF